jgi:hypothetical protein
MKITHRSWLAAPVADGARAAAAAMPLDHAAAAFAVRVASTLSRSRSCSRSRSSFAERAAPTHSRNCWAICRSSRERQGHFHAPHHISLAMHQKSIQN